MSSVKLTASPQTYQNLLTQVRATLIDGQQRIEAERVKTYWQTGRIIHDHILKHDRAEYGAEVVKRLSEDLNVDGTTLKRCIQFAKTYPHLPIGAGRHQFKWTHYRELITVSDAEKRISLENMAARKGWSAEELAARIIESKGKSPDAREASPKLKTDSRKLLTPLRGELNTYQVVQRPTVGGQPELLVDLGFGVFRKIPSRLLSRLKVGDFVGENFKKKKATAKDLFTYQAVVEKVIDGDTIKVRMDLGYGDSCREVLRLRDLDCAEMDTKEGQETKAFVQSYVKESEIIILRSSKSDKYDRYLADIYVPTGGKIDREKDIYLNNLLLETGRAVRAIC